MRSCLNASLCFHLSESTHLVIPLKYNISMSMTTLYKNYVMLSLSFVVIIVLLLYHAGVCSDVIIVLLLYHAGVAHLHGYTVEGSEVSGRKFSFSLLPPEPQMRKFSFVAENDTDKQRWGCMPLTFYCQELLLLMYMLFYKPFEEGPFLEH